MREVEVEVEAEVKDTKERILDAAELLFADRGFAATSMRNITARAKVNLAAVNYHFGSKEMLIQAVFSRRLVPLNRERLDLLDRLEAAAGERGPALEQIVEAFIGPPLRMSRDPERGGAVFMRLLGHAMNQPKDHIRRLLAEQFRGGAMRFTAAVSRAQPELPEYEIPWRLLFMAGAMAHTMSLCDELRKMYDGLDEDTHAEAMIERLVPFLSAGLRTPATSKAARRSS
jgi:AcrR family transcriptional regulator